MEQACEWLIDGAKNKKQQRQNKTKSKFFFLVWNSPRPSQWLIVLLFSFLSFFLSFFFFCQVAVPSRRLCIHVQHKQLWASWRRGRRRRRRRRGGRGRGRGCGISEYVSEWVSEWVVRAGSKGLSHPKLMWNYPVGLAPSLSQTVVQAQPCVLYLVPLMTNLLFIYLFIYLFIFACVCLSMGEYCTYAYSQQVGVCLCVRVCVCVRVRSEYRLVRCFT